MRAAVAGQIDGEYGVAVPGAPARRQLPVGVILTGAMDKDDDGCRLFGLGLPEVEDVALVGPREKVRDDLEMWRESQVTTMIVAGGAAQLRDIAELVLT